MQMLGDQLFRVSAFLQSYLRAEHRRGSHTPLGYEAVYAGGAADPKHHGQPVLVYPRTQH
jgi:hypothetical protein